MCLSLERYRWWQVRDDAPAAAERQLNLRPDLALVLYAGGGVTLPLPPAFTLVGKTQPELPRGKLFVGFRQFGLSVCPPDSTEAIVNFIAYSLKVFLDHFLRNSLQKSKVGIVETMSLSNLLWRAVTLCYFLLYF